MSILAIDTSSQVSSVAVASKEKLSAELTMQAKLTHSETLMPHIEQVLQMAGQPKETLEGIAVSIGPGSFTGLRIGLAVAKAMAYALDLPLVGVPTMQALACHFPVSGVRLVALVDAQKGNAYCEGYVWESGNLRIVNPLEIVAVKDFLSTCGDWEGRTILLGDMVGKRIAGKHELPMNVQTAPPHLCMPRAAGVAMLGLRKLAAGERANVMDLEPFYVRRSEAEVLWEKRHPEAAS
ncbi:MAG: tRNA (adenosine(37)-N6)-threonylcarbamoyltransferase complex dimerization subunit type 1 TsaB [Selenomonadaceae bacterium]|nr:tRNA (adenosine(37)-N6)-threonylcarbamoyltransferase complex dimerization subunit type 1 TsaB [Selenomonadaceae bacterium]